MVWQILAIIVSSGAFYCSRFQSFMCYFRTTLQDSVTEVQNWPDKQRAKRRPYLEWLKAVSPIKFHLIKSVAGNFGRRIYFKRSLFILESCPF